MQVELFHDGLAMGFRGLGGDMECVGNPLDGIPFRDALSEASWRQIGSDQLRHRDLTAFYQRLMTQAPGVFQGSIKDAA